ncbi:MAG: ATP-NAD kinase family protein [Desulfurococcaceae archaeon]|uniref:ATP-NAD kinase n=1 Tax=Staphylothermus marinus TaxID=2280 RepID=A0A7C4D6A9_STAMA
MGFIINPIAGMGGSVGLKGTDGDAYRLAVERGAKPIAWKRGLEFLNNINTTGFVIYTPIGEMGLNTVKMSIHRDKVVKTYNVCSETTTAEDTKRIVREMIRDGVDIIVFVGGDGTARDICEAVNKETVVLGVPSGVKMYSAVFAVNPKAASRVFEEFIRGNIVIVEREVLDIDEKAFRRDELYVKLHCYLKIPVFENFVQSSKTIAYSGDEEDNKIAIARYVIENMSNDTVYILGPGTTVKTINKLLGIPATILGVDVLYNYKLLVKDAWEKQLIEILDRFNKAKIILSPIGGQGFILGRGNQQISPNVIKRIGRENIVIVSTWSKIRELDYLRIDTGDYELDKLLEGYYPVLVDYNRFIVKKVITVT